MDKQSNILNWFEIPVTDMPRAQKFYETAFGVQLENSSMMGMDMAMFPFEGGSGKLSGALVKSEMHTPSQQGAVVYLNANPDMSVIDKIEAAGGKVVMPKTLIDEQTGHMAFFIDTEGNKVGLHSQK